MAGMVLAEGHERPRDGPPDAQPATQGYAAHLAGEVLVGFREEAGERQREALRAGLGARGTRRLGRSIERVELAPGLSTEQAIARYSGDPAIRFIEPNYLVHADELPDDPRLVEQYGLWNAGQTGGRPGADIDVEPAWRTSTGSHDVLVAVLDTGIDRDHPDLAANLWTNPGEIPGNGIDDDDNGYIDDVRGWDFHNDDDDPNDDNGHGTHVAGIIGAVGDNGIGVCGVSWKVRLVALKFLGSNGVGSTADAIDAIDYARRIGARITNNSWGGAPFSQALGESIRTAADAGSLFVASAGNDGRDTDAVPSYPAGYEDERIVSVAMTDQDGRLVSASNYGARTVDLAAPGFAVLSTVPGGLYRPLSGTSMAAPHVAGAAALLLATAPDLAPDDLKRLLVECARPDPALEGLMVAGGHLSVRRMLEARDRVAPGAIDDLRVERTTSDSVLLRWTAPGDDGNEGRARRYDLRRSESLFDPAGFTLAPRVLGVTAPGAAGSPESFEIRGLEPDTTYYFALVAVDEWSNSGPPSGVVPATTSSSPRFDSTPERFEVTLFAGEATERTLAVSNTGDGPLEWRVIGPLDPEGDGVAAYAALEGDWLAVDRAAGSVLSGHIEPIRLSIDARRLDSGVYAGSVDIATNDPARPLVAHAVRLLVQGAPVIEVDPPLLDLGPVFTGIPRTATLSIRNLGAESLHVRSLAIAAPLWEVEPSEVTIAPRGAATVQVTLSSPSAGAVDAALVVESDAPHAPRLVVPLRAQVVSPPGIAIDPPALHAASDGAEVRRTLSVTNSGASPLEVSLSFQPAAKTAEPAVLVNGGFESGDFSGWSATSNGRGELTPWKVVSAGSGYFLDSNPHEGRFDALNGFDGDAGLEYDLIQTFVIPSDAVRADLSYRERIQYDGRGDPASLPRLYRATIEDPAGNVLLELAREEVNTDLQGYTDRGWRERRADLAALAGRTLRLHVHQHVPEPFRGPAMLELDDFRVDLAAFPSWVRVEPLRATIAPGQTLPVEVIFDPGSAGPSTLAGALRIESNAPDTPTLWVELGLAVGARPDIAVSGPVLRIESTREFGDRAAATSHELRVIEPLAGGGMLEVEAEGNFEESGQFASVLVEGRALGTLGRSGAACSTVTRVFPLAAAELAQLASDGAVEVEVRNHPDVTPYCPRNRHRVALEARSAAGPIDFAVVAPGSSATRTIAIANRGAQPLTVHSIASDASQFGAAPGSLVVPPFGETAVELSFEPDRGGLFAGRLTLDSDDPDTPRIELALSGRGGAPPALAVAPSPLEAALDAGSHEARSLTLTLSNTGDAPLEFDLSLEEQEASAPVFELLGASPTPLTCVVADPAHGMLYAQAQEGTAFFRYDSAEAAWVLLAEAPIDSGEGCGAALLSGKIYTAYIEDSRLGVYDIASDAWSTLPAPVGHTANLAADGASSLYQVRNRRAAALDVASLEIRTIAAPPFPFDPAGGLRYLDGRLYGHQGHAGVGKVGFAAYDVASDEWTVLAAMPGFAVLGSEIDPVRRTYTTYGGPLLFRYSIDDGEWLALENPYFSTVAGGLGALSDPPALYFVEGRGGRRFAHLLSAPAPVRFDPARGTIPPGASEDVKVALSAADLAPGVHETGIVVSSDDPFVPSLTVPLHLRVDGVPDIAIRGESRTVSSASDYETSGAATRHHLSVEGIVDGPARLEISVNGDFGGRGETAAARILGVAVGEIGHAGADCEPLSTVFLVERAAPLLGGGALELELSNDTSVDSFCAVNRHGASLTYGAGSRALHFGRVLRDAEKSSGVTVANRGTAVLHVTSIESDEPRFAAQASALVLEPGTSALVPVSFRPGGAGSFAGTLTLESDDPDTPLSRLSLTGEGIEAPRIAVTPQALAVALRPGETALRRLTLANTGSGPLELALSVLHADAAFLALDAVAPLVGPGLAVEVTARIDSRGLEPGEHAAEIRIATNDPASPLLAVPLSLSVIGVPRLSVHGEPVVVDSQQSFIRSEERTQHVLPVERPHAGGAALELIVEGDFHSALSRSATAIVEGRQLGTAAGSLFECEAASVSFALSPAELDELAADGIIEIEVQNSQFVDPGSCPVNRHAVRLRYDTVLERLDFGTHFAGIGGERTIVLENTGTAPLSIHSISSDAAEFVPVPSSLALAPGQSAPLSIEFRPSAPGELTGRLRIESDDARSPRIEIPLSGVAAAAPRIGVEPGEIDRTLERGGRATLDLVILNDGAGPLAFELGVSPPTASFVTLDAMQGSIAPGETVVVAVGLDATNLAPSRHEAEIEIASTDPLSPLLSVPLHLTVTGSPALRLGGAQVTVTSVVPYAGAGAATLHRLVLSAAPGGSGVVELTARGDYAAEGETALLRAEGIDLGSSTPAPVDCGETVSSFALGAARLAALGGDGAIDVEVRNSRTVGAFCPINRHALSLRYPARVDALDFGEVELGSTARLEVFVENAGTDVLRVSSIDADPPEIAVSAATLELHPGARSTIGVTFAPAGEGAFEAELGLTSNDPAAPRIIVPLRGAGVRPPALTVDGAPIEAALEAGSGQSFELRLGNTGGATLDFALAVPPQAAPWLAVDPASGTVAPGGSVPVALRIDTNALFAGAFAAALALTSNDPARPTTEIPVSLDCRADPALALGHSGGLDFGTVLVGRSRTLTLEIENAGRAPLHIASVATSDPAFATAAHAPTIAPLEPATLIVSFTPSSAGSYSSRLVIASDDPAAPFVEVELSGQGADPPVLELEPQALEVSLPAGGNTESVLVLANPGPSVLDYSIAVTQLASAPLPAHAAEVYFEPVRESPAAGDPTQQDPGVKGLTCIVGDPAAGVVYAQEQPGRRFFRSSAVTGIWEELAAAPLDSGSGGGAALLAGRIYTSYGSQSRLGAYDIATDTWSTVQAPLAGTTNLAGDDRDFLYLVRANLGRRLDPRTGDVALVPAPPFGFSQWSGLRAWDGKLYGHAGGTSASFGSYDPGSGGWTTLAASPGPALLGAAIDTISRRYAALGSGRKLYRYALDEGAWDEVLLPWPTAPVAGLAWLERPVSAIYVPQGAGAGRALGRIVTRPSFLVVDRHAGSIAPGGSTELRIGFDARRLDAGRFDAAIVLTTNDLARPTTVVPATLLVSDAPHLSLLGTTVRYESHTSFSGPRAATVHALATPARPVGPASVRATVTGDFGDPRKHATLLADGAPIGLVGGTGVGCVSVEADLPVGAAELAAFVRDGTVEIELRNSELVGSDCEENVHGVELSYREGLERVDFGSVVVGSAHEIEITLANDGTSPLAIEALETDRPELVVGPWPAALAPGESAVLRIALRPLDTTPLSGTLTVASNDPHRPRLALPFSGAGVAPPSIEVDPLAIDAGVSEGGSVLAGVTISNPAKGALWLDVLVEGGPFVRPSATRLDVAPGGTAALDLALDAADLGPGAHTAILVLSSNDPSRPRVEVPVRLDVTGAPNLVLASEVEVAASVRTFQGSGASTAHALVVPTVARAARLELDVEGDFGLIDEAATLVAEGRELGTLRGLGPDCARGTLGLTLDAALLRQLTADGIVGFDVRNSAHVDAICPANRHELRLRHYLPIARLDLGPVILGASAERRVTLLNTGSVPLEVVEVGSSAPEVVVAHRGPSVIAPGELLPIPLTFTPSAPAPFEALLSVASNDPDTPVLLLPLSGRVLEPPRLEVEPRELFVVLSDGDEAMQQIILHNTGAEPLEFVIAEEPPALPYLALDSHSGIVPPGGSLGVTLRLDSAVLAPGASEVVLAVSSNDPLAREVRVPLHVTRLGRPDIALRGPRVEVRSVVDYAEHGARTTHALALPAPAAGAARLQIVADGDFGLPGETATVRVEGRVLGSVGHEEIDCIPATGSFSLGPNDVLGLTADGVLQVEVQNSPAVAVFCQLNRHTLVLSYDTPLERLDLGSVFVGAARAATVAVRNDGHGDLHVASVSCDDPRIEIPTSAFVVAGGATVEIPLLFAPLDATPLLATLTFVSDDLDEPLSRIEIVGRPVAPPALAEIEPAEIRATLPQGPPVVVRRTLRLRNSGASSLAFSAQPVHLFEGAAGAAPEWVARAKGDDSDSGAGEIAAMRSGGPDAGGYRYRDSDESGGPPFVWQDARTGGTALSLDGDDVVSEPQPLPFDFPFYGRRFGAVHVSSDGWLSFTDERPSPSNPAALPSIGPSVPANLIAPFWDDLHLRGEPRIHVRGDATRFVAQWSGVDRFAGGAELTFQAILYPSGAIVFQYLSMSGRTDSATIGIQNGERNSGLLVAYNASYVHDGLAIELVPAAPWLELDPAGGTVPPGGTVTVAVELSAVGLEQGRHSATIEIATNDPARDLARVPVTLDVGHVPLDRFSLDAATLRPASRSRAVRARLQLPPAYDPHDIDIPSVTLAGTLAPRSGPVEIADTDGDGIPELILEFDRPALLERLSPGESVEVFVSGRLAGEEWFAGVTEVRVPRRDRPARRRR